VPRKSSSPTPKRRPPNGRNRPRPRIRWKMWALAAVLAGLLVAGAVCVTYAVWASSFDMKGVEEIPSRSTVFDMDGKLYTRLQGENRIRVESLEKVSPHFIDALLAREDVRFYSHRGVDPIGIVRAVVRNVAAGGAQQGASTLTQQLARNTYPERISGKSKNVHRKLLEAFVAARIEQHYKKDEILMHYMNRIYFGSGVYGIEAASQTYFGKPAEKLSLGEAAMIAGIIRAPTYASPFQHPERATRARDAVLDRMAKAGKIKPEQAEAAKTARLNFARRRALVAQMNYAMDAVERDLNILLTDEQRADGGLKIYTTIDPTLQKAAEEAVDAQLRKVEARPGYSHPRKADFSREAREEEMETPYLQGAALVIDNRSGAVRALVGGRDYAESKFNRVLKSRRQVGSTFKPFVYAAAYRRGLLPGASVDDGPIRNGEIRGAANWTPENSDGAHKGVLRAEEGLVLSRNTMSVRVGDIAGLDEVARVAESVGIKEMPRQPAVFLGAFEATLWDVTAAYSTFPNNGVRRQSYIIERIDDASGEVIYRAAHVQAPALDPGVSWLVTNALAKVFEKGTATSARSMGWKAPAAGKTGTTNDYRDAWFIGYTSTLTCGVWVGLDQPDTIMARGYGAALALPIWVDIMRDAAPQRYPAAAFRPGVPMERVIVCATSSGLATSGCARAGSDYAAEIPAGMTRRAPCPMHHGGVLDEEQRPSERTRRPPVTEGILRSFRRFFGGD
jgi:penicillin-binding protein 1A